MKNLSTALASLLLILQARAQFSYATNTDGTIIITRCVGSGNIVVPDTINGLPVTALRDFSFSANNNLSSVTLPTGLATIGNYAFGYCSSLTNIAFPNGMTNLGRGAFDYCSSLPTVLLPKSLITIGPGAFAGCSSLTNISVEPMNPAYISRDGILFNNSQTALVEYPAGRGGSYTLTSNIRALADYAFSYCGNLTAVSIPNSVTNIGEAAFTDCTSLSTIEIPDSVGSIGAYAFERCNNLTEVAVPNGVLNIGRGAFSQCDKLSNAAIPASVTNIGLEAFASDPNLKAITVDLANPSFSSMNGVLFDKQLRSLIQFPAGLGGEYVIPNTVTTIEEEAFLSNAGLTAVTIPNSLTNIREAAFAFCSGLTTVRVGSGVTSIESSAFYSCTSLSGIYFAANAPMVRQYVFSYDNDATAYILPGATGWNSSFGGIPTVLWNPHIQMDGAFGVQTNQFDFNLTGTSNLTVVVEACTNLANPNWTPVGTNTLVGGSSHFSDPQSTNYSARFYRLRSP